jgi:hypothetical protein
MSGVSVNQNGTARHWLVGRVEPSGDFTVQVAGVPELQATAATRAEAIERIGAMLSEWLASGQLMSIELPPANPLLHFSGHLDPNDPVEQDFLEELARHRQQDLEQTLREEGQECSDSSSTPTT